MLHFESDYNNGCHEAVMKALIESNGTFETGYGDDRYTALAKERIRKACNCPDADIFLLSGGTQTNTVVVSSVLKQWQGAVSTSIGHLNVHEAGALEHTGHKVLTVGHTD
ncbi:MAG: beta-eliminating lyase-related protein, partial [Sphaerochaetaceae bacterium]|nr:beta-eliminating lyase-related protein [Sphaerochaetaceae bacterium]